jgi:accessory colonization factor AcfC
MARPGIKILDVNGAGQLGMWEDLAGKQYVIKGIQQNIGGSFGNTALGINAWKADKSYDAWITYASWYIRLKDITTLVKIPASQTVYRGTPVALTTISKHKQEALRFITFMQSEKGHVIFRKWGWE